MSDLPKRVAALIGALLFLVTTAGLTVVVIWQAHQQSNQNTQQSAASSSSCPIGNGSQSEILPDPEIYKPDVGTVSSLQSMDLQVGAGAAAKNGDCLEVKYFGTLASNGQKFDANFDQPTTLQFQLGQGKVIMGWDQGLVGIKVGGTRRLVIPPSLGYGSQATAQNLIPANSTLVFVVKLENIKH